MDQNFTRRNLLLSLTSGVFTNLVIVNVMLRCDHIQRLITLTSDYIERLIEYFKSFKLQDQKSILPNFFFFIFQIFAIKLGHFKVQTIFSYTTNTQGYQQKMSFYEEKSLVGLAPGMLNSNCKAT